MSSQSDKALEREQFKAEADMERRDLFDSTSGLLALLTNPDRFDDRQRQQVIDSATAALTRAAGPPSVETADTPSRSFTPA